MASERRSNTNRSVSSDAEVQPVSDMAQNDQWVSEYNSMQERIRRSRRIQHTTAACVILLGAVLLGLFIGPGVAIRFMIFSTVFYAILSIIFGLFEQWKSLK
jgi:hypothetical protein